MKKHALCLSTAACRRKYQMTELLKTKKAVFFDVGYTLDYPASGDWMLTNKFKATPHNSRLKP